MLRAYWQRLFGDGGADRLAHRMPIGLRSVFMHCDPQLVRDFYHRWYRPELMAIVVVGDFGALGLGASAAAGSRTTRAAETSAVTDLVRSIFADMGEASGKAHEGSPNIAKIAPLPLHRPSFAPLVVPAGSGHRDRVRNAGTDSSATRIGESGKSKDNSTSDTVWRVPICLNLRDSELSSASVSLEFFERVRPHEPGELRPTPRWVSDEMTARVFMSAFDRRLSLLAKGQGGGEDHRAPFLSAGVGRNPSVAPGLMRTAFSAQPLPVHDDGIDPESGSQDGVNGENELTPMEKALERALSAMLLELLHVQLAGFEPREVEGAKARWRMSLAAEAEAAVAHNTNGDDDDNEDDDDNGIHAPHTTEPPLLERSSEAIASECVQHFTHDGATVLASPAEELRLQMEALERVNTDSLHEFARRFAVRTSTLHARNAVLAHDKLTSTMEPLARGDDYAYMTPGSFVALVVQQPATATTDAAQREVVEHHDKSTPPDSKRRRIADDIDPSSRSQQTAPNDIDVTGNIDATVADRAAADARAAAIIRRVLPCAVAAVDERSSGGVSDSDGSSDMGTYAPSASASTIMSTSGSTSESTGATQASRCKVREHVRSEGSSSLLTAALRDGNDTAVLGALGVVEPARGPLAAAVPDAPLPQPEAHTMPSCGATQWTLANGITVCTKRTPHKRGVVSFQAFALGGSSELGELEEAAFYLASDAADESGLGTLSAAELSELQATTRCRVHTQRHMYHRGIGGSAASVVNSDAGAGAGSSAMTQPGATGGLRLLLAMLRARLTAAAQPLRRNALSVRAAACRQLVRQQCATPEHHFGAAASRELFGDVPQLRPLLDELIAPFARAPGETGTDEPPVVSSSECDATPALVASECARDPFMLAAQLYALAFTAMPAAFTFVFVGDLPPESATESEDGSEGIGQLLQRFLGTLPTAWQPGTGPTNTPNTSGSTTCADALTRAHDRDYNPWARFNSRVPTPLNVQPPTSARSLSLSLCLAPKATVLISYVAGGSSTADFGPNAVRNTNLLRLCCALARTRLLELLRLRDGTAHVYSVTCEWSQRSLSPNGVITAAFTCDPCKASALAEATAQELTSLGQENGKPPNADEVHAVVQLARERHRQAMRDNSSWLFWLLDTYKHHAMERARSLVEPQQVSAPPKQPIAMAKWIEDRVGLRTSGQVELLDSFTPELARQCFAHFFRRERSATLMMMPAGHAEPESGPESFVVASSSPQTQQQQCKI